MLPSITSARSLFMQVCRPGIAATRSLVHPLNVRARTFASVLPSVPADSAETPSSQNDGPLRPHLGVEVNPNHGLYAFFRKRVDEDGNVSYDTVEPFDPTRDHSGRSWSAAELRRKSFKDLHTLWYVLLRERNLLATQKEELRRIGADLQRTSITPKSFRVRKSMARIKYVINERRLAYEGAIAIHESNRRDAAFQRQKQQQQRQAKLDAVAAEKAKRIAEKEAERKEEEQRLAQGPQAADMAAAGLFDILAGHPTVPPESQKKSS